MALLFIDGGDDFARHVFTHERRGYWSRAFPLLLEKYGHMCLQVAGPEALADPGAWSGYDAVLVARLPPATWTEEIAAAAIAGPTPFFVEGPLAPELQRLLGVTSTGGGVDDGSLLPTTREFHDHAMAIYGLGLGGPVVRPANGRVSREPARDWQSQPRVEISPLQAMTWRAPGWSAELWRCDEDVEVLAEWQRWAAPNTRTPALVRRGSFYACAVSIFAYLGQAHTAEPTDGAENRGMPRLGGIEALVLAVIDDCYRRAGLSRARVLPWPCNASWVRHVRHDFDRALTLEQVREVLAGHARVDTAATWYWRSEPRGPHQRGAAHAADLRPAELVAATTGHEVALHTELLWDRSEEEQGMVEAAIQGPVRGTTAHGASNCFRYQGAPNVLWAEQRELLYTEFLFHAHMHPHRCAALAPDGRIDVLRVIGLPHHASFDASTTTHYRQAVEDLVPVFIRARGMMQIMNHPDVNQPELFDMLAGMPREGRLDWTAAEAAAWWAATHSLDQLQLVRTGPESFHVIAVGSLEGLAVEVLDPDGSVVNHELDLTAGRAAAIGATPAS